MQYMNWSWDDLMRCPAHYVDVIVELMRMDNTKSRS
jgi:hypothetical protein